MHEPEPPVDRERSPLRRLLSGVDRWASRPLIALIVIAADMAWVLSSVALGFPGQGERIFQTLVAAVTLAMVFVIQHTQAREQAATQRKLDEILQALPGADDSLLMLEHASHDDVRATSDAHREIREAALDRQSGAATPAEGPVSESEDPARCSLSALVRGDGQHAEQALWLLVILIENAGSRLRSPSESRPRRRAARSRAPSPGPLVASQVVAPDDHAVMAVSPACRQVHRSPKEVHGIPNAVSYRALGFLQQATQLIWGEQQIGGHRPAHRRHPRAAGASLRAAAQGRRVSWRTPRSPARRLPTRRGSARVHSRNILMTRFLSAARA